ncbi:MAG: VWA domain-containing protein [bacterium]|nr:VWA domain-containing protein [bacterium]
MSYRIPNLFLPLAFLLVLGAPANASDETPVSSFVDRVDVEVVNVEVFVTDQDGRRVTGLTREDFELYEDGRPVELTNFYAAELPPAAVAAEPSTSTVEGEVPGVVDRRQVPEEQTLRLMVFIDYFNILPHQRNRVLAALDEFLAQRLVQGDLVMLTGYSGSIEVIKPFTDDRRQIDEGLEEIRRSVTQLPSQQMATKLANRWATLAAMHGDAGGAEAHAAGRAQEDRLTLQQSLNALDRAMRSLGTLPGRKAMVYVSGGLKGANGPTIRPLIRGIPRTANARLVTFYALDARGPTDETLSSEYSAEQAGGDARTVLQANRDWSLQQPLFMMSAPTGGSVIINTLNFTDTLRRIGEDFDTFYSLGYASRSAGDGKYHKIEVKLRRPELSIRHRNGYLDKPLAEKVADRTLSSLVLDREANPLGIGLDFGQPEKQHSDEFLLPILVRIPTRGVSLLPREEVVEGRLRIYLAVGDEVGRFSSVQDVPYPVRVPREHLEKAQAGDIGYQTTLKVRPGTQRVAVGVWDEISGAESFVNETVVVGEAQSPDGNG